jgi:hypothetical protein
MQPATAGNVAARSLPGGRKKMNALTVSYLLILLIGMIVIVVSEGDDDGGAA